MIDEDNRSADGTETDQLVTSELLADARGHDEAELIALLEALLLVSPEPAEVLDLADAAEVPATAIEQALATIGRDSRRGWVVVRHGSTVHLASAPRFASAVRRF